MQNEKMSRDEFLLMFREDIIILSKYIPWFEVKKGDDVSKNYVDGERMNSTLTFPVYDTILLSFLNEASMTVFMERNYRYFYTRNHIHSVRDELKAIERADIMHMDILQCILSKYVMGGMTKAYLWKDGVDNGVFLAVIKKAKEIIEFWELPLYIADEIVPEEDEPAFEIQTVDVYSSNVTSSIDLTGASDDDWSDEDIARILAGLDDDQPVAEAPVEVAPVEEVAQTEAAADDEWSDEDIARILAEAEADEQAASAEEVPAEEVVEEAPVEAAPVEEVAQTEAAADDEWSDEDIARILAEAEADEQAASAEEVPAEEEPAEEITEEIVEEVPAEETVEEITDEIAEETPAEEEIEEVVEEPVEEAPTEPVVADNDTMPAIHHKAKRGQGRKTNKRRTNN